MIILSVCEKACVKLITRIEKVWPLKKILLYPTFSILMAFKMLMGRL